MLLSCQLLLHSCKRFVQTMGSCCAIYGVFLCNLWGLFVQPMGSFCATYGVFLCNLWGLFVQPVGSFCATYGVLLCNLWGLIVQPVGSYCATYGVFLCNLWGLFVAGSTIKGLFITSLFSLIPTEHKPYFLCTPSPPPIAD